MNIAPALLRQIQVEGITAEDYRRVQPKIEAVKQMAALFTEGMFIFDLFKMNYYVAPDSVARDESDNDDVWGRVVSILENLTTPEGLKQMWKACADMQNFYRNLPAGNRNDYITYWCYSALCKIGKQMFSSKCVPLEFAPDGRMWLTLETFTTMPDNTKEPFCIYNIKTNELSAFNLETNTWEQRQLVPLSDKENTILLLMAQGKSVKEVGFELQKSEDTIRSHQKSVFKKLGAHSAVEAIGIAKKYGLIKQWLY